MSPFVSSALGAPYEYDTGFANEVGLLVYVEAPDTGASQMLRCRSAIEGSPEAFDGWTEIPHTHAQAAQVQFDLNEWQKSQQS